MQIRFCFKNKATCNIFRNFWSRTPCLFKTISQKSIVDQKQMIFPDVKDGKHKEVLFIKETSDLIAVWEGAKLTKEQAKEASGIENIYWHHEFDKIFKGFVFQAENIYLNSNDPNDLIKSRNFLIILQYLKKHIYYKSALHKLH
jgi:hypothetical protein